MAQTRLAAWSRANLRNVFSPEPKLLAPSSCLQGHTAIMRYFRTGSNKAKKYLPILLLVGLPFAAWAQEDKKTDDDKPADPDTGESTVEEKTLGESCRIPSLNTA